MGKKKTAKPVKPTTFLGVNVPQLLNGMMAANSIASYSLSWRLYSAEAVTFEEAMKPATLARWRQKLVDEGYATNSVNIRIRAIKTIARRLKEAGTIHRHVYHDLDEVACLPETAMPERRRPFNKTHLEPEQMRALCKAPPVSEDNVHALRDRAFLMTLATTGCRISEVARIKFRDISKRGNGYVVNNIMGKHQGTPRRAPLSTEAYQAIMDWMEFRPVSGPYLFVAISYTADGGINYSDKPLDPRYIAKIVSRYANGLGILHVKPHDFRRFVATQLIKKEGIRVAQKVLGHADISTTAAYDTEDFGEAVTENLF